MKGAVRRRTWRPQYGGLWNLLRRAPRSAPGAWAEDPQARLVVSVTVVVEWADGRRQGYVIADPPPDLAACAFAAVSEVLSRD
jgi:hypothetical protein